MREITCVREERKAWSMTLVALASHFEATSGGLFLHLRSRDALHKVRSVSEGERWDEETLRAFFHYRKPELDDNTIMAPVRAGHRVIGVLALARERPFERGVGREATEALKVVGSWVGCQREIAGQRAECAVAKAALAGIKPKDLAYRILHQVRRFIDYNHGAAIIGIPEDGMGRILARQVAWGKGKSDLVGRTLPIEWKDVPAGKNPAILVPGAGPLWDALCALREEGSPPKQSIMICRLAGRGEDVGLVEVSSSVPGFFIEYDIGVLARYRPYLAWCARSLVQDRGSPHG
jgi:hypothetical protein